MTKTNIRYHMLKQYSFVILMHLAASVRETHAVYNSIA